MNNEVRVTSSTGGEKGSKPSQLASAPADALLELGKVYGYGSQKYAPHNFRKGYELSLTLNALWRHILAFQGGEDIDPESGCSHMAHAAWHCLNAIQTLIDHPEFDDRYSAPQQADDTIVTVEARDLPPEIRRQLWQHGSGHDVETVPDVAGRDC